MLFRSNPIDLPERPALGDWNGRDVQKRLNRAIGQLNGVKAMVEDNRYCTSRCSSGLRGVRLCLGAASAAWSGRSQQPLGDAILDPPSSLPSIIIIPHRGIRKHWRPSYPQIRWMASAQALVFRRSA